MIINKAPDEIPIICLMGATATGKTDAAAQAFDQFGAEIISVDSSLVYQGMNIGTAKPDEDFLAKYPHHLVDVCLLYTSPSPRDLSTSRMPSSA